MKVGRAQGTKNRKFAECHTDKKHYCNGLCRSCYQAAKRKRDKEEGTLRRYPETKRICSLRPLGWTLNMFNEVLAEQGNKCAICKKELNLSKVQNGSRACADHVHSEPPIPRGILCTNCNAMIGQAQESPNILRAAALYIEKFLLVSSIEEANTEQVSA